MDQSIALDIAQKGMEVALMVSLPVLALTLFIGLAVSVFQALTQIQEMTLTYVPKLLAVCALVVGMGNWMLGQLVQFTVYCLEQSTRMNL